MDCPATLVCLAPQAAKDGAEAQGEKDHADDVPARKRRHDGAGNIGGEVFDRTLRPVVHGCGGVCRQLRSWHEVQQFFNVAIPGQTRLPGIHDHETNRHGYADIDEADAEQFHTLAQWEAGTDEGVEDRKENQRDGEGLEQRHDEQAEPAKILVAQAAQIGLPTKSCPKQRATGHGDEHLCVQR